MVGVQKTTYSQNFTDDASTNGLLKDDQWHYKEGNVVVKGMTLGDLKDKIAEQSFFNEDIKERLVIRYRISVGKDLLKKAKYIDKDSNPIPTLNALRLRCYTLMVKYNGCKEDQDDKKRKVDVSYDSNFMTEVMPKIGNAVRDVYHWVLPGVAIYLYLGNTGGDGTKEAVDAYVKVLKDNYYHIKCIHQCHCLLATNMLDLGVWMAFQCVVEKEHFHQQKEMSALARTVDQVWENLESIKLKHV